MAAHRDDIHRPLLEDRPRPPSKSFSDSVSNASPNTEMADMASQTPQADQPNPADLVRAVDEYDVITDADVRTRGARRLTDLQRKRKARERVTWTGFNRPEVHSCHSQFIKEEEDEVAENLQEMYNQEGYRVRNSRRMSSIILPNESSVIDGRFSSSFSAYDEDGFVSVEDVPFANGDMSTTRALGMCNKYVLRPYHAFLKVIGWRSFRSPYRDSVPWYKRACNVVYPTFIFIMMLFTCGTQILICFSRTSSIRPVEFENNGQNTSIIECERGLLGKSALPDILILVSYIWALILFRFIEPENLSTLIETVFLTYHARMMGHSQKNLVCVLLFFLVLGFVWVVISTIASVFRIFALGLTESSSEVGWFIEEDKDFHFVLANINGTVLEVVRWSFAMFSLVGFLFFDLLYIAVMVNYSSQCELLKVYIRNIKLKVRSKSCLLGDAVKEIYHVFEFLKLLNGQFGYVTSLIFFVFLQNTILSVWNLLTLAEKTPPLNIIIGFVNVFQWLGITLLPVIQAARLTSECRGLKALGLEIGARPYVFSDTPQLVLDSFITYTSATDYKVKLAFLPVYPEVVFGTAFMITVVTSVLLQFNVLQFAPWI